MKVLLLNGSPHAQGCTYTALCEVAGALEKNGIETEIFHIGTKPIAGCIACGSCLKTGKCVFDDGVNEFVEKAKQQMALFLVHRFIMQMHPVRSAPFGSYLLRKIRDF